MVTVVTVHHPAVMPHQQQPEKMPRKKKLGAQNFKGRFICLSDKMCDKIPNPIQEEVSKKAGLGLKKIVFDLEDTEE